MSSCAKCKQCKPFENDSWCIACAGVESLVTELAAGWHYPAFREAANDLVVSAVRGVKSLRTLDATAFSAGSSRAAGSGASRPALPRSTPPSERAKSRAPTPPPAPPKQEEESDSGESGDRLNRQDLHLDKAEKPTDERNVIEENIESVPGHVIDDIHQGSTPLRGEAAVEDPSTKGSIVSLSSRIFVYIVDNLILFGLDLELSLAIGRKKEGAEMVLEEGQEFNIESPNEWQAMLLNRNEIIEVHLPSTNLGCLSDLWAGFWIKQVLMLGNGDYGLICKSLGCSDPEWTKYFSGIFNRRVGRVHLCESKPCATTEDFALHVTRLRLFSVEAFDRPYMNQYVKKQLTKWQKDELEALEASALDLSGAPPEDDGSEEEEEEDEENFVDPKPKEKPAKKKDPPGEEEERAPAIRLAADKEKGARREAGLKLGQEEKAHLRKRLEEARAKMLDGKNRTGAGSGADGDCHKPDPRGGSLGVGYTPSLAETAELEQARAALEDMTDKDFDKALKDKKKRKEKEELKENRKARSRSRGRGRDRKKDRDIKDITTRNLQSQLVLKAAETARQMEEKTQETKKKKRAKSSSVQLAKILTRMATGKDPKEESSQDGDKKRRSEKEKKRKKKRERRRKQGMDPDDSPSSSSSGMSNSGKGSRESSEDGSVTSEEKHLEAPLKRRSRAKPGSVLQMLIDHARSQLDQTGKVSVGPKDEVTVLSGLKMGSYFSIVVRPQLGTAMAQTRELHHLAQAIDLLRQGSLDVLGDVLAGRFISLHQSVIDGSWQTARHLELLPLEDGTAATPEVLLRAKKHAKLQAKLAPGESWTWQGAGKGRGGRGRGSQWSDQHQETKGKGKKGQKGKGKAKNWHNQEKGGETREREKVPEK
eukprot:s645_g3.t1